MSWGNAPSRGWPVGVGASPAYGPSYDADEEERLRREYAIDPGRRWNQLAEERERDPAAGWLHTILSPFEVPNTAMKYASGVAQGLVQTGLEHGASAWGTMNGQTVPVGLPRALREMGHPMGDEPSRLDPTVRNIFDPGEALARYHALTPEPAQLLIEGMGTWGLSGFTKVPQALNLGAKAQEALAPGQGALGVLKNTDLLGPLGSPTSPLRQAAGMAVSPEAKLATQVGAPVVGGTVMGLTAPEDSDPWARATRVAEGALGGLAVGAAVVGAQNYLQRTARLTDRFDISDWNPNNQPLTPLGQRLVARAGEVAKYEDQPTPRQGHPGMTNYDPTVDVPALFPEGGFHNASANMAFAQFRGAFSDRNAPFGDLIDWVRHDAERQGIPWTDDMDVMGHLKVLLGAPAKAENWIQRYVPASAIGTQTSVLGAKGVIYDAGVRNAAQLEHLEELNTVMVAMGRAGLPEPLATGHLGKDVGVQAAHLQELKDLADQRWPGLNLGDRMEQAGHDMTAFYNAILDYHTDFGQMLPSAVRDEAKSKNLVYAYIKSMDDVPDSVVMRPELPTEPLLPTSTKVKEWFSEDDPTKQIRVDYTTNMSRVVKMVQLAEQNNFGLKVRDVANQFPDALGSHWRPLEDALTHVEKGWEQVRLFDHGEPQYFLTTKPIGDLFRGINVEAADAVTGTMAKISKTFSKAVTVYNPGFIVANMERDLHGAMINSDIPVDIVRHWPAMMSSMFTHSLDDWFRYHQDLPVVKNLPQTVWEGFRDHVLKPWGGANTAFVDEAINQGIGMTTVSGVIRGRQTAESLLGIKPQMNDPGAVLATHITKPLDMLEAMANISEMSTRLAVMKAEIGRGTTPFQAGIATREATVDFSKAGNVTRLANLWLPLLNARLQGELRTFRSVRDDPAGFMMREMALTGVPSVMSYAWNRTMFPDLYDMIPSDERMRNHILVYGQMTDDNDRVKPLYLRLPKDQISSALTLPLDHILDTVYHTRYYGQPPPDDPRTQAPTTGGHDIEGESRTQAPTSWTIMRTLGSLLPTDMYPNEVQNPVAWITSALTINPVWNVGQGIQANQDPFRRQPIVPEEQMVLPPEYRYGPQTPAGYKSLAHVATKLFEGMGINTENMNWLSPSVMQFATRGMGGSVPDYLLQQLDIAVPKLQEVGLVPPGAFVPATLADLKLPPGTPIEVQNQYISQLESPDSRPAYARIMSRFIGASARAPSMTERASHLGQREQDQARETQDFNRAYQKFLVEWRKEVAELDGAPNITHQAKLDGIQRLGKGRAQAYLALQTEHPLAITDQKELRAFQDRLPGVGSEWMQEELPTLPPGWSGQKIAEYLMAPPGVDMAKLSVTDRYKAQRQGLNVLSKQLGQPVSVLEMYAGVHKLGAEVPGVAVPNLAIEQGLNAYLNPTDAKGVELDPLTTPAHLMQRAREAALHTVAATWGVPPDTVKATMDARLNNPMELNADGVSRMRATMLWQRLNDPGRFPTYVNPDGSALGDEAQWAQWDADLAKARTQYHDRLPPQYARLETAKKFGEMRQLQALATHDPQTLGPLPAVAIADHERWYGTGRAMSSQQWAEYQSGALPRYSQGGPSEWAQWDMMQKMYAATPAGPMKDRMRNQVRRVRALQTPGWRDIIQKDQLLREDALWDEMQQP